MFLWYFRVISGHFRYSRRICPTVFGHSSEILCRRRQQELIPGSAQTAQSQTVYFQHSLHVREQHFDLLALAPGTAVTRGLGYGPSDIPG